MTFGSGISPQINARVRTMAAAMESKAIEGVIEIIPTYRSLCLTYVPLQTAPHRISQQIAALDVNLDAMSLPPAKEVEIPVCYGGEFGPDMAHVQAGQGLSQSQVVEIHSDPAYQIYMVGFAPGYPFLGGLDERLFTPRLKTPRMAVPRGSVGIANNQTGIYPIKSPGGWQIIGRTPLNLFRPYDEKPFLYQAGDTIRFRSISLEAYNEIAVKEGTHEDN